MRKLKYNKETNEIDIKESPSVRGKNFFEKYEKLFIVPLQILSVVGIGIGGLIITYFGGQSNEREKEAHEAQMEAIQENAEPNFFIKSRPIKGEFEENGYFYTKRLYTLMNRGGKITNAYISDVRKYMMIELYGRDFPLEYKCLLDVLGLFEMNEELLSIYDEDEKEFVFYERETNRVDELEASLRLRIENSLLKKQKGRVNIYWTNTVSIEYSNYENKQSIKNYQFVHGDSLIAKSKEDATILGTANIENDIDYIVRNAYNRIEEVVSSGKVERPMSPKIDYDSKKERDDALGELERYLDNYASSRAALLDLLENKWDYYHEDAIYAVDNCGADWNEQAVKKAQDYLDLEFISYGKLIEALKEHEKFTSEEAVYGADNCNADWNEQSKKKAEKYMRNNKEYSRDELINRLESVDKFTHEQAVYGADSVRSAN